MGDHRKKHRWPHEFTILIASAIIVPGGAWALVYTLHTGKTVAYWWIGISSVVLLGLYIWYTVHAGKATRTAAKNRRARIPPRHTK